MNKVVIITGGSSGIGKATVEALKEKNSVIYELSRKESSIQGNNVTHINVDITDELKIKEVVKSIFEKEKRIDVLINNAGFGISGAVEFTGSENMRKQFEVNFMAVTNITRLVLPYMRDQKSGKIINISSVAAVLPIPYQTYYSVTKSAINSFTKALSIEVKQFNIYVCAVMLGDIKTDFTKNREKIIIGDDIYNGRISRSVNIMEKDEQNGMKAEIVGKYISKIVFKKKVKVIYTVGFKYKLFVLLSKILSVNFVTKVVGKIYG